MSDKIKMPIGSRLTSAVPAVSLFCGLLAALIRIMQGKSEAAVDGFAVFLPLIILAVSAVFTVVSLIIGKDRLALKENEQFLKAKHIIPPMTSLLAGLLLSATFGVLLYSAITAGSDEKIQPIFLVISVLGLLSGIFFIFNAYLFYVGHSKFNKISLFSIIPSVWMIILLSVTFMKLSTVANVSAYYYDIVAYCALLVFLLSYAKAISSIGKPKILFVASSLFISCALAAALPRAFMWDFLTFSAEDVAFSPLMIFAVLALAIFAEESMGTIFNYNAEKAVEEQVQQEADKEVNIEQ